MKSFIGLIANETSIAVNLRQAYGKEDFIPRSHIVKSKVRANPSCPKALKPL